MDFQTTVAVEAPQDFAFARCSDFDALADRARGYGATVTQTGEAPAAWQVDFNFRGRDRRAIVTVADIAPPENYSVSTVMDGLVADVTVTLSRMFDTRCTLSVASHLKAKTLTGRLLLQSLKLAKGRLDQRYAARVRDYAEMIEDAWREESRGST